MSDSTASIQKVILDDCSNARITPNTNSSSPPVIEIKLQKGDYAIQTIEIPKSCQVVFSSKDRARLLYVGKRNRPMFVLNENSGLILKEKLEIYYNTNNIREVLQLMIRSPQKSSRVEISPEVKISLFSLKQQQ